MDLFHKLYSNQWWYICVVLCSAAKECPWEKHLTCLPKLELDTLSYLFTKEYFTMELIWSPGGIVISTNMPMGDELKTLLLSKGVGVFLKLWYFFQIHLPHSPIDACMGDSAMLLLSCAYLCSNTKWCPSSSVSPTSCTVLFFQCFLLSVSECTTT